MRLSKLITESEANGLITLRAILDKRVAQEVIGSKGMMHQFIEKRFQVSLYLSQTSDNLGRLCSIAGSVDNVGRAFRHVLIVTFRNMENLLYIFVKLLIPRELLDKLKQGENNACSFLDDLSKATKVRVTVAATPLTNTTEYIMTVSVPGGLDHEHHLDCLENALCKIGQQFQRYRHESLSPKNIYYIPFCHLRPVITDDEEDDDSDNNNDDNGNEQEHIQHGFQSNRHNGGDTGNGHGWQNRHDNGYRRSGTHDDQLRALYQLRLIDEIITSEKATSSSPLPSVSTTSTTTLSSLSPTSSTSSCTLLPSTPRDIPASMGS